MSRRNLPEKGDLVIGTVSSIYDHGVYVKLDEYEDLQAYCHVSEVSSTWVRNIRNVMRLGKKIVGRVMRVKENQIDVSIKRVSDGLKRSKIEEWKHYKTALTLLEMGAKKRKEKLILKQLVLKLKIYAQHTMVVSIKLLKNHYSKENLHLQKQV